MTVLRALLPAALALTGVLTQQAPASATPTSDLQAYVQRQMSASTAKGISVAIDVDGVGGVYRQSATSALLPASTEKLVTVLTALEALGPNARLRTELRSTAKQQGATLPGDLWLVAGGDPYLTSAQLQNLAARLKTAGLRRITGSLRVDDARYDTVRRAPGWQTSYVPDESGPLSALALDRNAWRKDAAYLREPTVPTLLRFKDLLKAQGITVVGGASRGRVPAGAAVLTAQPSATVADLVRRIAKDSDNFAAELLFKEVGRAVVGKGSTAGGVEAARSVLGALHISVGQLVDGSGLSSQDRQTAATELSLLTAAQQRPTYAALRRALPVACKDGTLVKRMCGTAAEGRAVAKTGSLPGVTALTGWTTTADGHSARFVFLLSGASSTAKARAAVDASVAALSAAHL